MGCVTRVMLVRDLIHALQQFRNSISSGEKCAGAVLSAGVGTPNAQSRMHRITMQNSRKQIASIPEVFSAKCLTSGVAPANQPTFSSDDLRYYSAAQLLSNRWVMLCILNRLARGVSPNVQHGQTSRILGSIASVSLLFALAACGGGSSSKSNLQVSGPAITTQPVGPEIAGGQTATLTVVASGSGTLSYQWYQGPSGTTTNAISGANSSSYTTLALTATTSYWVQVSDSNGSAASNTAVVLIAGKRAVQALIFSLTTQPPPPVSLPASCKTFQE